VLDDRELIGSLANARSPLRIIATTRKLQYDLKVFAVLDLEDDEAVALFEKVAKSRNPNWANEGNPIVRQLCSKVGETSPWHRTARCLLGQDGAAAFVASLGIRFR
jgi:hypothetical protein